MSAMNPQMRRALWQMFLAAELMLFDFFGSSGPAFYLFAAGMLVFIVALQLEELDDDTNRPDES